MFSKVDAHSLYLLNLAVCDLLLTVLCMPLHMMSTLCGATWALGSALCWVYSTVQLTLLNVSSLVLLLVTLDGLRMAQVKADHSNLYFFMLTGLLVKRQIMSARHNFVN